VQEHRRVLNDGDPVTVGYDDVPRWDAGPDTPEVAQTALSVRPEVRTFLADYMKNVPR